MNTERKLEAMKAVYCYFFPEVAEVVKRVDALPKRELYLTQTPVDEAAEIINQGLGLATPLEIPAKDGRVDLDELHEPIIDRIVAAYAEAVPGLAEFKYRYPTSGSSEGIFHYIAKVGPNTGFSIDPVHAPRPNFVTLAGEYEGYREYSKALGLYTAELDREANDPTRTSQRHWIISNPSAIDGNILPNQLINKICDNGNRVAVDLAYVGATPAHTFDVSHPNIEAVFLSFSKPYGLFRERIGFTFSREPIDSLYANKWFKSIPGLLKALVVAEEIGPNGLPSIYRPVQERIVRQINEEFDLNLLASDAILLAHLNAAQANRLALNQKELLADFARGSGYRLCLTPYFEREEAKSERR